MQVLLSQLSQMPNLPKRGDLWRGFSLRLIDEILSQVTDMLKLPVSEAQRAHPREGTSRMVER